VPTSSGSTRDAHENFHYGIVGNAATFGRMMLMREQVEAVIEMIRPALQSDGGDIVLLDVDEDTGVVEVELVGACGSCPSSTMTLKAGVERIMRDRVEGVTELVTANMAPYWE
jgi:Fe-S cluster biogenesis protein NfuA